MTPSGSDRTPTGPDDSVFAELVEELTARVQAGQSVDIDRMAGPHPEHAERLRALLPALRMLGHLGAVENPSAGGEPAGPRMSAMEVLGDFRFLREVGRGGMGVVYEAEQLSLGRRVALKVLPFAATLDPRQLLRFRNEAQAAALLQHAHIVPIYFVGCERGVHYYAMQYIEGQTLADLIDELRQQPPGSTAASLSATAPAVPAGSPDTATAGDRLRSTEHTAQGPGYFRAVAQLGEQAARALQHAHEQGIIHRDIKPGNLMLDVHGHLWLTDFGLARVCTEAGLTFTGDVVGTLRYMSPEQALGRPELVDHRTDVYSLGVTLYELLTLHPALGGDDRQELLRQLADPEPPPRPFPRAVPRELQTIVHKAMARSPQERYGSAAELADDLRRFLEDRPIQARRPSAVHRLRKWCRRHRVLVTASVLVLVLAVVLLGANGFWWAQRRAAAEAAVEQALTDAINWHRQGKWPEALSAAYRARDLLAGATVRRDLEQRVQREVADLEMVQRLHEIQLQPFTDNDRVYNFAHAHSACEKAFTDYGLEVMALKPAEAAQRIQQTSIALELATAVDFWAMARRETRPRDDNGWKRMQAIVTPLSFTLLLERALYDGGWKHLQAVAMAADPDEFRNRIRGAWGRMDRSALRQLAAAPEAARLPASTTILLGKALYDTGSVDSAAALLRQAQPWHANDFWFHIYLGYYLALQNPPDWNGATRFFTAALALRPQSATTWLRLGYCLSFQGELDEAIADCRRALELKPDYDEAYSNLGNGLTNIGLVDEGVEAFQHAIRLRPDRPLPYANLADALVKRGDFAGAAAECRKAIVLAPNFANAHINLGDALLEQGQLTEALRTRRRAHMLAVRDPMLRNYPTQQGIEEVEHLIALNEKLPAFLRGKKKPADAAEQFALAQLCRYRNLPGAAVGFYQAAFAAKPELADDLQQENRFTAACTAARAAAGTGQDGAAADAAHRSAWRKQALDWLRADLQVWTRLAADKKAGARLMVRQMLGRWRAHVDLASLHDKKTLAALPEGEQKAWRQFWAEVDQTLAQARARGAVGP